MRRLLTLLVPLAFSAGASGCVAHTHAYYPAEPAPYEYSYGGMHPVPYDSGGGWCTDWVNGGRHGPPEWERFHIGELIPFVDARLRTRARRAGRAIAGLSQGGFCAMSYAARHPDRFVSATSFSDQMNPTSAGVGLTPSPLTTSDIDSRCVAPLACNRAA